ncbi:hypothetical protein [Kiloniella sp. b19]|uniref:hypothetical protein n=1 Tax=Kiloniella sp. GXU_MW_B19 TaxID=3141326 RepID=UPI0031E039D3
MASQQPPSRAIASFPVIQTCVASWTTMLSDLPMLIRMAAYPFVLSIALTLASVSTLDQPLLNLLISIAAYIPMVLFAVAWHRRTLHDKAIADSTSLTAWKRRHWRFFSSTMMIIFLSFITVFLISILTAAFLPLPLVLTLCVLGALYIAIRLCFIWPAAAVEEIEYDLKTSWQHTAGQSSRIFFAYILVNIPSLLLVFLNQALLMTFVVSTGSPDQDAALSPFDMVAIAESIHDNIPAFIGVSIVISALSYLPVAANFSLLSLIFRQTTGWVPEITQEQSASQAENNPDHREE